MILETPFWLFSTIAQTYAAILGIIGMLTVYKLQQLSNEKNNAFKEITEPILKKLTGLFGITSPKNLVTLWPIKGEKFSAPTIDISIINNAVSTIERINKVTDRIKAFFLIFMFVHVAIIGYSITTLLFWPVFLTEDICTFSTILIVLVSSIITAILFISLMKE